MTYTLSTKTANNVKELVRRMNDGGKLTDPFGPAIFPSQDVVVLYPNNPTPVYTSDGIRIYTAQIGYWNPSSWPAISLRTPIVYMLYGGSGTKTVVASRPHLGVLIGYYEDEPLYFAVEDKFDQYYSGWNCVDTASGGGYIGPDKSVKFNNSKGFVCTFNSETGEVSVDLRYVGESGSQVGLVNNTTQTFIGKKHFVDNLTASSSLTFWYPIDTAIKGAVGCGDAFNYTYLNHNDEFDLRLNATTGICSLHHGGSPPVGTPAFAIGSSVGSTGSVSGLTFTGGLYTGGTLSVSGGSITGTIDGGTF